MAKLTLIGLQNYLSYSGGDLFADIQTPTGINKDVMVNSIILKAGEFELLYSNADFLKKAIELWFLKNSRTFTKWIEALSIDYNPLENYDRQETWTDNANGSTSAQNTSNTQSNTNSTVNNNVSAFDSSSLQPSEQQVNSGSASGTDTSTGTATNTNNSQHSGRIHGNIGVTTSQQMLEAELSIDEWNVYDHISDMFVTEFCLMIY